MVDINELLKKYDIPADDYTDYPHKRNWSESMGAEEYRQALKKCFSDKNHAPSLLYVHVPFCPKLCFYCLCHKEITSDYSTILDHFDNYLSLEIKMLHHFFEENSLRPNFKEIFIGGGSPTMLKENEFDRLIGLLRLFCDIPKLNRFCIEIDPRTCSPDRLRYYHRKGVTTISIGVQDLDEKVQKAVNRVQPAEMIEQLLAPDIRKMFNSVNFDFLVGLPLQTEASIQKTMEKTIALSPDRISLCHFNYTTQYYPHMEKLKDLIPDFFERKRIFAKAVEILIHNGYVRTGFEHFAKPADIVARSVNDNKATYTSLGVISGECQNVVAAGRSGHGIIGNDYLFQNYYEQERYADALSKNKFPIYRGIKLNEDDMLRRDIIKRLRTYFVLEIAPIQNRISLPFRDYFRREFEMLPVFAKDGLVILADDKITITETGKYFASLIAGIFDRYLRPSIASQITDLNRHG